MRTLRQLAGIFLLISGSVSLAQAHMVWLNASNHFPKTGETVTITIGWGHRYPGDEKIKESSIDTIFVCGPEGAQLPLNKDSAASYAFTPKTAGTYIVIVKLKRIFFSTTTDGRKMGNKKNLENVVSCVHYGMQAETFITAGSAVKCASIKEHLSLALVPQDNLQSVKVGGMLNIRLDFQGKPLKGVTFKAVDESTAQQEEDKWVHESASDSLGVVVVTLVSKGPWLFLATHEAPYTDASLCDKESYRTTATFMLK